ncbi:MAG: septum formation inhibitor Maf [Aquabacterium sp.]|jgi:septum formation protein|nr:MAG: septum formation inhibitor Maf [Aquabacterium sp.]
MSDFIYLASQSPRRRELLGQLGVRHELLLPGDDEDAEALEAVQAGEAPEAYVQRVTRAKLEAALQRLQRRGLPPAPVLCSDTTVALDARILGKPADDADAAATLAALSGREHRVITGVAVGEGGRIEQALHVSRVWMREIQPQEIERYVRSGEPRGKAGSYAIQGRASEWIERIDGSHSGIMGLPVFETAALLRRFNVDF